MTEIQRVAINTPNGRIECAACNDSAELAGAVRGGELSVGDTVFYRGMLCVVTESGSDDGGEAVPEIVVEHNVYFGLDGLVQMNGMS